METIQSIRNLRKELGVVRLPAGILDSVKGIKTTLQAHADQNSGWRKVEWRGGASSAQKGGSSGPTYQNRGGNTTGRMESGGGGRFSSSSSSSRSRNASHFTPRDTSASIPLTYTSAKERVVHPSSSEAEQGFEVVQRSSRRPLRSEAVPPPVEFRSGPPQKYVSKFKRAADKVEDTILNTILLGKLNKFSASNYDDIKEFITQIIDSGQTDMMKCFMKLVFEKAASEEIFCPLYAKLLSELSAQYPVLLTEMASLYSHYMSIFEEVSEQPDKSHQEFCQRNVEKKYRRGYSQFLAELTKHRVIESEVFVQTVLKIVEQIEVDLMNPNAVKRVEELADCLVRMLKAIPPAELASQEADGLTLLRITLKENVAIRIQPLTVRRPETVGLSNKARFTFMDIYEGIQKY